MGPSAQSLVRSGICSSEPDAEGAIKLDIGVSMDMLTDAREYSVDFLVIEPDSTEATIVHRRTDEFLFVVRGGLVGTVGDRQVELPAGGYVEIRRGTPHTFTNAGPENCHLISFCVPRYDSEDVFKINDADLGSGI